MGKKADILTTNQRVNRICEMFVRAYSARSIIQYSADQWGLGERQTRTLMQRARARLIEDANIDRQDLLAARLQTLELVIRKATDAEQYSNVIGAIKLQCELTGTGYNNAPGPR